MPDDLGVGIRETVECKRERFALCPEVVKVRAVDAREEVAGPPHCRNNNHGVGVADIELILNLPRDVKEGRGDACLQTEQCPAETHHNAKIVAVLGSAEHVVDEAFAPIGKKPHWVGNGDVGFAKIEGWSALSDGEGGDQVINFLLFILISSRGGNSVWRGNVRRGKNMTRTIGDRHLVCFFCDGFCRELQKGLLE
jgi:hypothetical protein